MKTLFEQYFEGTEEVTDKPYFLDNINAAVAEAEFSNFGNVVHVVGTNGKGSTSHFISQILTENGLKVGLFTSPHLRDIRERISFLGTNISLERFDQTFQDIEPLIKKYNLTYFEAILLLALKYFEDVRPDALVLEAGLGGRLDATNIDIFHDKTVVITSIAQDHVDRLGKKVVDIADEKAAVVRDNGRPIFLGLNTQVVIKHLEKRFADRLRITNEEETDNTPFPHPYDSNYRLASSAAEYILHNAGVQHQIHHKNLKLPPCRLEYITDNIILDGAHNPNAFYHLKRSLNNANVSAIITSITGNRDITKHFNILKTISNNVIVIDIPGSVRKSLAGSGLPFLNDPDDLIVEYLDKRREGILLITGSLRLCGYIRDIITSRVLA